MAGKPQISSANIAFQVSRDRHSDDKNEDAYLHKIYRK